MCRSCFGFLFNPLTLLSLRGEGEGAGCAGPAPGNEVPPPFTGGLPRITSLCQTPWLGAVGGSRRQGVNRAGDEQGPIEEGDGPGKGRASMRRRSWRETVRTMEGGGGSHRCCVGLSSTR